MALNPWLNLTAISPIPVSRHRPVKPTVLQSTLQIKG